MLYAKLKYLPLIGKKIHKLTIIDLFNDPKKKRWILNCLCECGKEITAQISSLKSGNTKSCGVCYLADYQKMIGQKYTRLTILEVIKKTYRKSKLLCKCDCGSIFESDAKPIIDNKLKSCGCLRKDIPNGMRHGATRGRTETSEYTSWRTIRHRCENESDKNYNDYGGRGITLCDRWKKFENFLEDMGPKPTPLHTLDRIDNNKGYGPDNCKWATRKEQANNRRPKSPNKKKI